MYYNYHAQAQKLILEGHLVNYVIVDQWGSIKPALVLFFDNHRPMPIRSYRWDEYMKEGVLYGRQTEEAACEGINQI